MTMFQKVKLSDIADVIDSRHQTPAYSKAGYPMVRVTDIKPGYLKIDTCLKVDEDVYNYFSSKHKSKKGDMVFSRVGSEGIVSLVNSDQPFCLGQNTAFVVSKNENNYLYYWLNSPLGKHKIKTKTTGSTQRTISLESIKGLELTIPTLLIQESISSILTTYDDLIENNEKRIKALEEMTQLLYTEWFVKFKFPGHEKVRMVDSGTEYGIIPEGWDIKRFGEIIELAYGKALKEEKRIKGNIMVYGSSGFIGTHNEKLVNGPGIVVGRKGNAGAVHWVDNDFYPIDTTYYVKSSLDLYFIYYSLKNHNFVMGDVAVPGLNRNQTYLSFVLLPPAQLIKIFSATVWNIFNLVSSLSRKNLRLGKMRDLLITQLVTGKRVLKEND